MNGYNLPIELVGSLNEFQLAQAIDGVTAVDVVKSVETFVSTTLTFLADPPEAAIRGKISCDVSTNLTGTMSYGLFDMDLVDGTVEIGLSAGLTVGGISFAVSTPFKLGGDDNESAVYLAYGFSSDDLGAKNPEDANLIRNSASLGDLQPLSNYTTESKAMTHSSSATITKAKNGAESKAMYQGFVTTKAHATKSFCAGWGRISDSKIKINVENVRYLDNE